MASEQDYEIPISDYIRNIAIGLAIVLVGFLAFKFRPRSTFAADGLSQHWDATVEQSRSAHMPVLVLFTADWCPACNALHENVLSQPRIADEINNHYLMVTVDLTAHGETAVARAQRYHVAAIPTLIRFDADGNETDSAHYMSEEKMMNWLREGEEGK